MARTGAVSATELEAFAAAHVEIGICRDIANGFKHHSITRASVDAEFAIVAEYIDRYPHAEWTVLAGGHQFSLLSLSERAVQLWSEFLQSKGLAIDPEDG